MTDESTQGPATGPPLTSLALYNYGHFTSMLVVNRRVKGLDLHLQRLARDCRSLFDADLDLDDARRAARSALEEASTAVIRVTVFDPGFELGQPERSNNPVILATARAAPTSLPLPLRVQVRQFMRDMPQVKNVGLFGSIRERRAARLAGFDDALFSDTSGALTEGVTWNFLLFDQDGAIWPTGEALPGVTARIMRDVLDDLRVVQRSSRVALEDLPGVRAVYALNSVVGVRRIASVDGHDLATDDKLERQLQAAYGLVRDAQL